MPVRDIVRRIYSRHDTQKKHCTKRDVAGKFVVGLITLYTGYSIHGANTPQVAVARRLTGWLSALSVLGACSSASTRQRTVLTKLSKLKRIQSAITLSVEMENVDIQMYRYEDDGSAGRIVSGYMFACAPKVNKCFAHDI